MEPGKCGCGQVSSSNTFLDSFRECGQASCSNTFLDSFQLASKGNFEPEVLWEVEQELGPYLALRLVPLPPHFSVSDTYNSAGYELQGAAVVSPLHSQAPFCPGPPLT